MRCWGDNQSGELGDGTGRDHDDPRTVAGLSGVADIQADYMYSCAVLTDGTARCWGSDRYGQFGDGQTGVVVSTPVLAYGGATLKQLSLGEYQSCALFPDGHVACTGLGSRVPSGDDTTLDGSTPAQVPGLNGVQQITSGANFTCALLGDQTVSCWGAGTPVTGCAVNNRPPVPPTVVPGVSNAIKIVAGSGHACALLVNGTVTCWGADDKGQLGTPVPPSSPCNFFHGATVIPSLTDVTDVGGGDSHTCALLKNGTVMCWGYNAYGQLGNGTTTDQDTPQLVPNLMGVAQLVVGYMDACAILGGGVLECWGAVNPFFSPVIDKVPTRVTF